MKTFVLMSKKTPQGPSIVEVAQGMAASPQARQAWINRVHEQCPDVKFVAHYALLGGWDFMDIYQAPDEETAAMVSMICTDSSAYQVESWLAIPDERIRALAAKLRRSE
jgi:uncharacterized protein with GYD domain